MAGTRARFIFEPVRFMPVEATSPTACVILAAGESRRMGRPKQLLTYQGKSMLARTAEAALAIPDIWPVVVVLGAHADLVRPSVIRLPVLVAENPAWVEGMASSLRVGLEEVEQFSTHIDRILFTLCDQPALEPSTFRVLLDRQRETDHDIVAAHYGNHPGAPAVIHRRRFPALAHLTGDAGARQLFKSLPADSLTTVDLPALATDLDTPEDYQSLVNP